jgi:hypothetical protein
MLSEGTGNEESKIFSKVSVLMELCEDCSIIVILQLTLQGRSLYFSRFIYCHNNAMLIHTIYATYLMTLADIA